MAEMVGNLLQGESGIHKLARAGVAQTVRTDSVELQTLLGQPHPHHGADAGARQRPVRRLDGQEHGALRTPRTCLSEIPQDGLANRRRQRIALRPSQLRPRDVKRLGHPVDVVEPQSLDLAAPQAIMDQQ